jgi:hypothetical protein
MTPLAWGEQARVPLARSTAGGAPPPGAGRRAASGPAPGAASGAGGMEGADS